MLRIVAMIFIVISHASFHGGFPKTGSLVVINDYFLDWFTLGNLGVDIFMLITGYYMCTKEFKIQRVSKLLSEVWFYSLSSLVFGIIIGYQFTVKSIIQLVFPIIFEAHWFVTVYFVTIILSPFFNVYICSLDRKKHMSCITVMMAMWVVVPTFTKRAMFGAELPQYLMFYLIGAYFEKYPDNVFANKTLRVGMTALSFTLLFLSSGVLRFLGRYNSYFAEQSIHFYYRNSILIVGAGIGLFSLSVYRKAFSNSVINKVASCTFGVYLIHENPIVRNWLWLDVVQNYKYYDSGILVFRLVLSAAVVFFVCISIEYVRQMLIGKLSFGIVDRMIGKLLCFGKKIKKCMVK